MGEFGCSITQHPKGGLPGMFNPDGPHAGWTCAAYGDLMWGWCGSGAPVSQNTMGERFGHPEEHCCVCGGGSPTAEAAGIQAKKMAKVTFVTTTEAPQKDKPVIARGLKDGRGPPPA